MCYPALRLRQSTVPPGLAALVSHKQNEMPPTVLPSAAGSIHVVAVKQWLQRGSREVSGSAAL